MSPPKLTFARPSVNLTPFRGKRREVVRIFAQSLTRLLLSLIILVVPIAAQTGLGVVRGVVRDSSEAAVPNARIVLTETAKGLTREAQTNGSGIYYFGSVPIGQYSLAVES